MVTIKQFGIHYFCQPVMIRKPQAQCYFSLQVQFVITFSHSLQTYLSDCDFPLWGQYLLMGYMIIMLTLFGNFYFQAYIKKKHLPRHPKKDDAVNGYSGSPTREQNGNFEKQNGNSYFQNGSTNVANGHSNGTTHRR